MLSQRRRNRSVEMAQRQIDLELHEDGREHGYTICRNRQGDFIKGRETIGTHNKVDIDVTCPSGFFPDALFHTHPNGSPEPSQADIRAARRHGIKHLCIGVPESGETVCHEVCLKCRD